jgi:hypothetical protein
MMGRRDGRMKVPLLLLVSLQLLLLLSVYSHPSFPEGWWGRFFLGKEEGRYKRQKMRSEQKRKIK